MPYHISRCSAVLRKIMILPFLLCLTGRKCAGQLKIELCLESRRRDDRCCRDVLVGIQACIPQRRALTHTHIYIHIYTPKEVDSPMSCTCLPAAGNDRVLYTCHQAINEQSLEETGSNEGTCLVPVAALLLMAIQN
jgi:hypothetical protein